MRASVEARRADPTYRSRMSEIKKRRFADPAERERQSRAWTEEGRQEAGRRRREVLSDPAKRAAFIERTKQFNSDPEEAKRRSARTAAYYRRNPEARQAVGERTLKFFSDPENRLAASRREAARQAEKREVVARCKALGSDAVKNRPSGRASIEVWLDFERTLSAAVR